MISIRYDSSLPRFQPSKIAPISSLVIPNPCFITWYASAMICMSPYSMPLCTILTKWPAPFSPTQSQQGTPLGSPSGTLAAMA